MKLGPFYYAFYILYIIYLICYYNNVIRIKLLTEVIKMRDDMISAIRLFLRKQGRSFAVADQVAQHISNHTPDNMVKEMRDYWIKEATK